MSHDILPSREQEAKSFCVFSFIGFPRWTTSLRRNDVGGIQRGMPPWSQDALRSPRSAGLTLIIY